MSSTPLAAHARKAATSLLRLAESVEASEGMRYAAAPIQKPREDTDRKATGGHSDPTAETVLDPRRGGVNATAQRAENFIANVGQSAEFLDRRLRSRMTAWESGDSPAD